MAQGIINWEYKIISEGEVEICALLNYEEYVELVGDTEILDYRRHTILYDYGQIFVESEEDKTGYWVCDYAGEDEQAFKMGQAKVDELIFNKTSPGQLELNYEHQYVSQN